MLWNRITTALKTHYTLNTALNYIVEAKKSPSFYPSGKALNLFTVPEEELKVIFILEKPYKNSFNNPIKNSNVESSFCASIGKLDFDSLSKQGVGFISKALINADYWNQQDREKIHCLTDYILNEIALTKHNLIYVFIGKHFKHDLFFRHLLNTSNEVILLENLVENEEWNDEFVFERINRILVKSFKQPVKWN